MTHLLTRVLGTAFVLTMFCTLTLIAGDGDSKDGVNEPLPDGPAPYIMSAWYKSDGSIRLCASNAVLKRAYNSKGESIRYPGQEKSYFNTSPQKVTATFATGKAIPIGELSKILATQTLVVVSSDARPVDPMFLQLLKDDTIILRIDELPMLFFAAGPKDETRQPKESVTKR